MPDHPSLPDDRLWTADDLAGMPERVRTAGMFAERARVLTPHDEWAEMAGLTDD